MLKSACWPCRRPGMSSPCIRSGSWPLGTSLPSDLSTLLPWQVPGHTGCTYIHIGYTSSFSLAVTKYHDQKQLTEERVIWVYGSRKIKTPWWWRRHIVSSIRHGDRYRNLGAHFSIEVDRTNWDWHVALKSPSFIPMICFFLRGHTLSTSPNFTTMCSKLWHTSHSNQHIGKDIHTHKIE